MDYHNMQQREGVFSEDFAKSNGMEMGKIDPYTLQQIEFYLQQQVRNYFDLQHGVNVPAIIFEYLQTSTQGKENFIGWDYEDLFDVIILFKIFPFHQCSVLQSFRGDRQFRNLWKDVCCSI